MSSMRYRHVEPPSADVQLGVIGLGMTAMAVIGLSLWAPTFVPLSSLLLGAAGVGLVCGGLASREARLAGAFGGLVGAPGMVLALYLFTTWTGHAVLDSAAEGSGNRAGFLFVIVAAVGGAPGFAVTWALGGFRMPSPSTHGDDEDDED